MASVPSETVKVSGSAISSPTVRRGQNTLFWLVNSRRPPETVPTNGSLPGMLDALWIAALMTFWPAVWLSDSRIIWLVVPPGGTVLS